MTLTPGWMMAREISAKKAHSKERRKTHNNLNRAEPNQTRTEWKKKGQQKGKGKKRKGSKRATSPSYEVNGYELCKLPRRQPLKIKEWGGRWPRKRA